MARKVTRRGFFTRLGAAAIALTLARHLPGIAPAPLPLTPPNGIFISEPFQIGDVFTIAGRYDMHPITQQPTGMLKRFIVTAEVVEAGLVPEELIYPRIRTSGPYANVFVRPNAPAAVFAEPVLWPEVLRHG